MAQPLNQEITQPALSQRPIGPGRPVNGGGDGDGHGCMPGDSLLDLSLTVTPDTLFVSAGTVMQLTGSARVEHWDRDCSHSAQQAPIEWSLSYQSVDGQGPVDITSILADDRASAANRFTAGIPGIYEVVLACQGVGAATSARVLAGRGAVLDGTATAWINNPLVGCRKFDTDPTGHPIRFQAVIITLPHSLQSAVIFDPIRLPSVVIRQTSLGTGSFNPSTGTLEARLHAAVQGRFSGTVDMTLSTSGSIGPCDKSSVTARVITDGQAVLVGDAPVEGPPGTTDSWLAVNAAVTPVGF